jgi:uncharacterized protein YdeI (YjbR/CyaY-like superfamily)
MDLKVDQLIQNLKHWQPEFKALRKIALESGLDEAIKWRLPCYTYDNKNIAIIQKFKDYCALMFFKGALLKDPQHILVKISENTQASRQVRFTDVKQIEELAPILKDYLQDAIDVEKSGLEVELKKTSDYEVPEEFKIKLDANPKLKKAFEALTPGRQRAYLFYFASAKQSKTRTRRVEKYIPQILAGKGLND